VHPIITLLLALVFGVCSDGWAIQEGLGGSGRGGGPGLWLAVALLGSGVLVGLLPIRKRLAALIPKLRARVAGSVSRAALVAGDPDPDALLAGKYKLGRPLPAGSGTEGWEAGDRALERLVIVKKVPWGDEGSRRLLLARAKKLSGLFHPHIIDIYEMLEQPDGLYLVFEYADGRTVQRLLVKNGPFPLATAVSILKPAAAGLEAAHGCGIAHGNLKPSNLILLKSGYVKIMDFSLKEPPPEPADDVAALGACLYRMVTGTALPDGPYVSVVGRTPELGPRFDSFLRRVLEGDREDPVRTPAQFAAGLDRLL